MIILSSTNLTEHMISLLQLIAKLSSGMFSNAVIAFHLNLWVIY